MPRRRRFYSREVIVEKVDVLVIKIICHIQMVPKMRTHRSFSMCVQRRYIILIKLMYPSDVKINEKTNMRTGAHVKHLAVVFKLSSYLGSLRGNFRRSSRWVSGAIGIAIPTFAELNRNEKLFISRNRLFRARCGCSKEFKSKKLGVRKNRANEKAFSCN